jgi:hypothetical protein
LEQVHQDKSIFNAHLIVVFVFLTERALRCNFPSPEKPLPRGLQSKNSGKGCEKIKKIKFFFAE